MLQKCRKHKVTCFICLLFFGFLYFGCVELHSRLYVSRSEIQKTGYSYGRPHLNSTDEWDYQEERLVHRHIVQQQRKRRTEAFCLQNEIDLSNVESPRHLLTFSPGLVFCRVYKCASTYSILALRRLFCRNCSVNSDNNRIYSWPSNLAYKEKQNYVEENYSFFFVREPYRRLFSTYCNKFYLPKEYWSPIGPTIAKQYRKHPSNESLIYGHDVTFAELVKYVVDTFEQGLFLDKHLAPMYSLCNPCKFNYSYIGRLETISEDYSAMLQDWKTQGLVHPTVNISDDTIFKKIDIPEIKHFFRTKTKVKHSNISVYSLYLRTWTYYQIVGKISKYLPLPFEKYNIETVSLYAFTDAVREAVNKSQTFKESVTNQKNEALLQAYSTVSVDLLERLRKVVLIDCKMFAYEDRPIWLFNMTHELNDYIYFKGI